MISIRVSVMLTACLFVISCESQRNKNDIKLTSSYIIDTLNYCLDFKSNHDSNYTRSFVDSDGTEYFTLFNKQQRALYFYDVDSYCNQFKIQLKDEGPDRIGIVSGILVNSFDEIIFTTLEDEIIKINRSGEVIQRNSFPKDERVTKFYSGDVGRVDYRMLGNDKILLSNTTLNSNHFSSSDQYKLYAIYDFSLNSLENQNITVGNNYWDEGKYELNYSSSFSPEGIIISPSRSHQIRVYNSSGEFLYEKPVKSTHVDNFEVHPGTNLSDDKEYFDYVLSPHKYLSIAYDQYRKLYYRFYWYGGDVDKYSNEMHRYDFYYSQFPHFGILVLDDSLNPLFEVHSPDYTYVPHNYFISKKGLIISANHVRNPEIREDQISFHVFDFSKKN